MRSRFRWSCCVCVAAVLVACTASGPRETPTPALGTPTATAAPTAVPTPVPTRLDIRASRLVVPALHIDAPVQGSQVIPDTSTPAPGCPAPPAGQTTFTVPNQGIATPEANIEGLENKAWIFGHSRWQNQPGLFFGLQDLSIGDELFVDGVERTTGAAVEHRRFVVDGLYLTDIDSGGDLVTAETPADIPAQPVVILQTSVREDGANRQWLLDQQKVVSKTRNLVQGDVNDPCKYLLLFVFARSP